MRLYTKDRYSGPRIRGLYTYRNQGSGAGAGSTQNWFHSKQRSRETLQDTTVLGQGQGFVHSKKGTLKILKNEAKSRVQRLWHTNGKGNGIGGTERLKGGGMAMSLKIYVTKQHKESREINAFRVWLVTMEAGGPIALMMRPRKRLNGFSRAGGEGAAAP